MFAGAWRAFAMRQLERLEVGELEVHDEGRTRVFGRAREANEPRASLTIRDPRTWRRFVLGGSIGAAEAFADGAWKSPDPTAVVRFFCRNRAELSRIDSPWKRLANPLHRLSHALRSNTPAGSRKNIAAHYDLSNEFYELFLDPTMMYSCGFFESESSTMEAASHAKNERICRKLALGSRDHLLEIGTGWGGFAIHAAQHHGCRVTTTTISARQHEYATRRVREAGLAERITVLFEDYRTLRGSFDKLVSIEMIEAVGHRYHAAFFAACAARLKPDGRMLIQSITIPGREYDRARRSVDFIQRHVFPGSCIPSVDALLTASSRASDLEFVHMEDLTRHYARTLRLWRERFLSREARVAELGFSESFRRLWEYYFCYCEGGFEERAIGNVQLVFSKPLDRAEPIQSAIDARGARAWLVS